MFSYALVSGRIEAYEADSVRYVPSEYNPNTIKNIVFEKLYKF